MKLPKFASIKEWLLISGMTRRNTYRRFGSGDLKSHKVGKRVLVDVEAGLSWIASLPPAKIKPPSPSQRPASSVIAGRGVQARNTAAS
jgi:hypothetical protein